MSQFSDYPDDPWAHRYPSETVSIPLKTSGLAIASLACGAAGLVTCCAVVPSLLGIVFGVMARTAIRNGEAKGGGLAATGIILGVIGMIPGVFFFVLCHADAGHRARPGIPGDPSPAGHPPHARCPPGR